MPEETTDDPTEAALRHLSDCAPPQDCRPFLKRVLHEVRKIATIDQYADEKKRRVILNLESALRLESGSKQQEFLTDMAYNIQHINRL